MLPRDLLRKEPDATAKRLAARGVSESVVGDWSKLDEQRRSLLVQLEELKRQRNDASKSIGQLKKEGKDAEEAIAAVAGLKGQIEDLDNQVGAVDKRLEEIEEALPNVAHESVPIGQSEDDNRVERFVGDPRKFAFEAKAHWDLGPDLGILDFEEGAKLAGARFTVYRGVGARLERALANLMVDVHTGEHGYTEVLPPYMANADSMFASGQLPKFEQDLFKTGEGLYLIPTAEVALVNLHRDEVLDEKQLPIRYVAWTPCFRSEAGSYGKDVRGLIRQHQFHKVELVQLTSEETSWQAHEELTGHAEKILQLLELPYRVVTLSTGDMGFAASKTYDLEVWLPGQDAYREISSCSNTGDFQARRANIRYRPEEGGKPRFVHALNGSGLAVGRTLIAVLENYQQADGTVRVPEVLRGYLGGLETIDGP